MGLYRADAECLEHARFVWRAECDRARRQNPEGRWNRPRRRLERVEIADALKVKGLAPLACKTDRIDAWVLAELCRRDLVPAIWLPDPSVRAERERARFRLHLVRHRNDLDARSDDPAGRSVSRMLALDCIEERGPLG
jgi:hypothetical protein